MKTIPIFFQIHKNPLWKLKYDLESLLIFSFILYYSNMQLKVVAKFLP